MKIKEITELERPMEKLSFYGKHHLEDRELLAIIIKNGYKGKSSIDLADSLLGLLPLGLASLDEFSIEELSQIKGIGFSKAANIISAIELGRRVQLNKTLKLHKITGVQSVLSLYQEKLRLVKEEHFEVVMLDSKGGVIAMHNVSKGDLTSSIVHPRETFREAIKRSAASILCVHNHPSGDPTPSKDDIFITRRLVEVGDIVGIKVLDHIIIGSEGYVSMKEENLI